MICKESKPKLFSLRTKMLIIPQQHPARITGSVPSLREFSSILSHLNLKRFRQYTIF